MSDVEALARKMCAAAGLDPDKEEKILTSPGLQVASGWVHRPTHASVPLWHRYRKAARNALTAADFIAEKENVR